MSDEEDINRLAVDLVAGGVKAGVEAFAVTKAAAQRVKVQAQRNASGLRHAPSYPRSIGYDMHGFGGAVVAEIGPDKNGPQGALGNILEYGTSKNAPVTHLGPALDREGPAFGRFIGDIGKGLLA